MFGSSATTSSRASGGVPGGVWIPDTKPPVGRADAVVMAPSVGTTAALGLDATWELAGRASARGCHGPTASPVPDRVVLRPAQPPAPAQVGPDRAHHRGLRGHPGEDVVGRGV